MIPGKAQDSLLYKRISDPDPRRRMPPLSAHKELSDEQKALLRQWIEEGAEWKQHWAFTAPARPELPTVKNEAWTRNPIDRFVLAKLETNGLQPSAEANRRELIRRVTLDLTGLPPSPDEVEAFVNDKAENAPTRSWLIACWPPSTSANIARIIGWMLPVMPIRMVFTTTTIARCGRIATG